MTAHDPDFAREPKGILRWLGFGAADRNEEWSGDVTPGTDGEGGRVASEKFDPRDRRRRELLGDVGRFLLSHRIEVNPFTLAIAHDVITGADSKLAHMIDDRLQAALPLTLEWLEEASRTSGREDRMATLDALMAKLEASIEDFSKTTTAARSATSDYNSALEAHVGELEQVSKAGAVIAELATIAKVMLDRTREIEQQMNRSEIETRALQDSLEEARRKADIDHLTGLPNRRAFETLLQAEHAAAIDNGEPLCVAFCDIDHFKRVNDTHGHEAGDRVLRAVAQSLARISDDACHVARHGREEFVVLFRGKSLDEALQTLDEARIIMAERRLINRATDVPFGRITFSGGIADVLAYPTPRAALKAADEALYAAKGQGRNCVVKAGAEIQAAA
jgi:diguanylate cyclase